MCLRKKFDNLYDGTAQCDENVRSSIENDIENMLDKSKCANVQEVIDDIREKIKSPVFEELQAYHADILAGKIIDFTKNFARKELVNRGLYKQPKTR